MDRHIEVFIGPFGSGKTEVALNRALSLAGSGAVTFIDLDLVDPYFRARDAREALAGAGVRIVAPGREWDDVDLPLLSPEIFAALAGEGAIIVDAGGEAHGAVVLRQVVHLLPVDTAVYLVVNPYRPFMRTPEEIAAAADALQAAAGWRITALVANPHLASETTARIVGEGLEIVREAAARLALPVAWTAVSTALLEELALPDPVLPLTLHLVPPWEREVA